MAKRKIVHIFIDLKFVSQIKKFESPGVENKLIIWGEKGDLPPIYDRVAIYIYPKRENVDTVVSECDGADLVVLNSLIPIIVLSLPKNLKIAWRFFGFEIYERILPKVLSKETLTIYRTQERGSHIVKFMKECVLFLFPNLSWFNRSLKRVDYFLGAFQEEYLLLKSLGFKLPPFIQVPIVLNETSYMQYRKSPVLLLGNSRVVFNNHIDIIRMLEKPSAISGITVKLFFSYGSNAYYAETVRHEAQILPGVEFLDRFISRPEFERVYQQAAAVVINSYRQMALGNIFTALQTGTKIYLSERNVTYHWLKKHQFRIFSIEKDLYADLLRSDIFLSEFDAEHNFKKLLELRDGYTISDFQCKINNLMVN